MNRRDDVMERLAAARPPALEPDPELPRRAADLRTAMDPAEQPDVVLAPGGPSTGPVTAPGRRRHWRWTAPLLAAGLTGAVVLAGIVAPSIFRTGDPAKPAGPASSTGPGAARKLAMVMAARAEKAPEPPPGRYWRSQVRTITLNEVAPDPSEAHVDENLYEVDLPSERIEWTPRDGRAEPGAYERTLGFEPRTAADAAAWRASGSPSRVFPTGLIAVRSGNAPWVSREPGPWTERPHDMLAPTVLDRDEIGKRAEKRKVPTYERLRTLPTDPKRLRDDYFCAPWRRTDCVDFMTEYAYGLTCCYAVSPKLRAAVIRMLLAEPRVKVTVNAVDALGRRGIGFSVDSVVESPPTVRRTVIFDRRTGEPLGFTMTVVEGRPKTGQTPLSGHRTGQTPLRSAVVSSGWTDKGPEKPR